MLFFTKKGRQNVKNYRLNAFLFCCEINVCIFAIPQSHCKQMKYNDL